jgi:hypothetical protein
MAKTPPRKVAVKKKAPAPQPAKPVVRSPDAVASEYESVARSPYFRDTLGVKQSVLPDYMGKNSTYGYYNPELNFIAFNPEQPVEDAPSGGPLAGDRTPRQVLTHEGAHALDSKDKFPSYYSVNRPTFRVPVQSGKAVAIADALKSPSVMRMMPDKSVDELNMQDNTSLQPRNLMGILPFGTAYKPMPPSEVAAMQALDPYYGIGELRQSGLGELYAATNPNEAFAQAFTNAAGFLSETGADTTGYREKLGRYEGNTPGAGAIVRDLFTANPIYKNHPLKGLIR